MAFIFQAPDIYGMMTDRRNAFDRNINDLSNSLMQIGNRRNANEQAQLGRDFTAQQAQLNREEAAAQREHDLERQEQNRLYNAEVNARQQLVAKSSDIASKINDIEGGYDYLSDPEKYQGLLDNLLRQKSEIDSQLDASTSAIKGNPLYQNETLVMPVTAQRTYNNEQRKSMTGELDKRLTDKMRNLSWQDLININSTDILNEIAGDVNLTNADKINAFKRIKDEQMAKHSGLANYQMEQLKLGQAYRDNTINKGQYENKLVELAIDRYKSNAELESIAQQSKTQDEFVENLKGAPVFQEIAKISGLSNSQIKAFANTIWSNRKKPSTEGFESLKDF